MKKAIEKCCTRYLGSVHKYQKSKKVERMTPVHELLKIPRIVLIMSALFKEEGLESLPNRRTEKFEKIFKMTMARTTLKTFGCESSSVPNIESMLVIL